VLTIFKALLASAGEYIGDVETASLRKREPGKAYTHDGVTIHGTMEDGRRFTLELEVEDEHDRDQP
jgi:hypothetical protein